MEEERQIMKFKDEDGNTVELEAVAEIYLDETKYLILAPLDSEDDEFVFRVDKDADGNEEYNTIDDDQEFLRVKKEYNRILYDDKEQSDE